MIALASFSKRGKSGLYVCLEHVEIDANESWEGVIFRRKGQQKDIPPNLLGKGEMVV